MTELQLESLAFRHARVGISIVGVRGEYLAVNDRYCEIVGRSREEMLKLSLADVNHPDYNQGDLDAIRRLGAGEIEVFVTEKVYRDLGGRDVWARLSAKGLKDDSGKIKYFLGTIEDISAEKRSESNLREVDLRFQQVFDAIPDLVLVKGPGSRILWANRAFRNYYGMSNFELKGIIDASFSPPDQTVRFMKDDQFVFQTGQLLEIPREMVRSASGEERAFHTVKSPLRNEVGEIVMTIGVSRDITDKLAADTALQEQREKLAASAKMSALGVMAGGIAHEINNPLGIIQGITANLIAETKDWPSDSLREGLAKIFDTSVRIAKLVKGLRFFSRSADLDPTVRANPRQIVDDTLGICADKFKEGLVDLRIGQICQTPIECRPTEIAQVLLNLLQNAYDAVEGRKDAWVLLEAKDEGDRVAFVVKDSGPPIDPAVKVRMMDPFFTTKEVGRGTGLGLSLSKGIAESHGGTLRYGQNSPYTTFILSLPLVRQS